MNKPYENQMPAGVDSFVEESSKEEVKAVELMIITKKKTENGNMYPQELSLD